MRRNVFVIWHCEQEELKHLEESKPGNLTGRLTKSCLAPGNHPFTSLAVSVIVLSKNELIKQRAVSQLASAKQCIK